MKRSKRRDLILQGACTASKIRGQPVSGGAHFFPDAIETQPLLHWKPSLLMSSFQYFSTGLLRYNSQAIKFTALTYMTQWLLAYETLTIILYLIPVTPKRNSIAICFYSFPSLWQIASYVLSLHISYKWSHMLGSLLCPVWLLVITMLSEFTQGTACGGPSLPLIAKWQSAGCWCGSIPNSHSN